MNETAATNIGIRRALLDDLDKVIGLDAQDTGQAKPDYWRDIFDRYVTDNRPERYFLIAENAGRRRWLHRRRNSRLGVRFDPERLGLRHQRGAGIARTGYRQPAHGGNLQLLQTGRDQYRTDDDFPQRSIEFVIFPQPGGSAPDPTSSSKCILTNSAPVGDTKVVREYGFRSADCS